MFNQRCNEAQTEQLIIYMENHTLFARKQIALLGPRGHEKYQLMWEKLARFLNNFGPSKKSTNSWKAVSITNFINCLLFKY